MLSFESSGSPAACGGARSIAPCWTPLASLHRAGCPSRGSRSATCPFTTPTSRLRATPPLSWSSRQRSARPTALLSRRPNTTTLPPPEPLVAAAHERFDRELQLRHEGTRRALAALLVRFARWIDRERAADAAERALALPASAQR